MEATGKIFVSIATKMFTAAGVLAEYLGGEAHGKEVSLVYNDAQGAVGSGLLAEKLKTALKKKSDK